MSDYKLEVLEAGSHEVSYAPEGMEPFKRTYLVSLIREVQSGRISYVGTLFNESDNKPVLWNGGRRYVTGSRESGEAWFWQCMGLKREVA